MPKKLLLAVAIVLSAAFQAMGAVVSIAPLRDNTLIQRTDPASQLSNGQGDMFVGRTAQDGSGVSVPTISLRRGLVLFDVASNLPAGAIVTSATLTMRDVMGLNGDPTVELHRLLQDWGEGSSFFNGGQGATPQNDDATWLYRFYNAADPALSPQWTTAGGSFDPSVSAATVVSDDLGGLQSFSWSSAQMAGDVQSWLDNPTGNFGWLLKHTDETLGQTAKRFNSGESAVPPLLSITYVVPEPASWLLLAVGIVGCACVRRVRRRTD